MITPWLTRPVSRSTDRRTSLESEGIPDLNRTRTPLGLLELRTRRINPTLDTDQLNASQITASRLPSNRPPHPSGGSINPYRINRHLHTVYSIHQYPFCMCLTRNHGNMLLLKCTQAQVAKQTCLQRVCTITPAYYFHPLSPHALITNFRTYCEH